MVTIKTHKQNNLKIFYRYISQRISTYLNVSQKYPNNRNNEKFNQSQTLTKINKKLTNQKINEPKIKLSLGYRNLKKLITIKI